ncbi:unnamed protein product [Polarella glacialis]|uniref:Bestrophin homolog n=2 Tax=Polarella glacialis TaxID=89957 RepID=A0A813JVX5_POLGL|nr:unnamed protein product [Polarella glacialis]
MIAYHPGSWGMSFIFQIKGSVFPKAACWAAASAVIAVLVKLFVFSGNDTDNMNGIENIWSGYTFVLGFLMVFRNNQAYSRFWEGASLTKQMKGQWFVAFSGLFAYCSRDESKKADVAHFQGVLVRLASLLHCSALQQICDLADNSLEIINSDEMDRASMEFLSKCTAPQEVVTNWIQRLIVQATDAGTIDISAPMLARAIQEIGNGLISLSDAGKIKDVQFPFPYAQLVSCMLFVHWLFTPILAAHLMTSGALAGAISFLVAMSFWSLFYIALEIDQPFGEDANDLPIHAMQQQWNNSLLTLLLPCSQVIPTFEIAVSGESREPQEESNEPEKPEGTIVRSRRASRHLFRKHAHVHKKAHEDHFPEDILGDESRSGACSNYGSEADSMSNLGSEVDSNPSAATEQMEVEQDSETIVVWCPEQLQGNPSAATEQMGSGGASVIAAITMQIQEDSEIRSVSVRSTGDFIISKDRWKRGIFDCAKSAAGRFYVAIHSAGAVEGGQGSLPPHFDSSPDGGQSLSGTPNSGEN